MIGQLLIDIKNKMTRKITALLILNLTILLTACDRSQQADQNSENHQKSEIQTEKSCLEPKDLLEKMYQSNLNPLSATESELKQYFDNKLANKFIAEQKCAEKGGICDIDFNILYDSQDPDGLGYQTEETKNPFEYFVWIGGQEGQRIIFSFDQLSKDSDSCPRITNISYSHGDLLGTMAFDPIDTQKPNQ